MWLLYILEARFPQRSDQKVLECLQCIGPAEYYFIPQQEESHHEEEQIRFLNMIKFKKGAIEDSEIIVR